MIIALHDAPEGFFKTNKPHGTNELVRFVQKAESLGFAAVEIGPLIDYDDVCGKRLRITLDDLKMQRTVHVGGIFDAEKLATSDSEYIEIKKQIENGMALCRAISSTLLSLHPPFSIAGREISEMILSESKMRFHKLLKEETKFASSSGIKIALESFCYPPFIFDGLNDFANFVSEFPSKQLGILLDAGHVYQIGFDLVEAVRLFKNRLLAVHVHDATLEKDYRKATHLPIGKGTMNFPALVQLLREAEYGGWLSLEIRGSERDITESKEYLETLIKSISAL